MADRRSSAPDTTRGLPERQQNARDESRIAPLDPRGYEDRRLPVTLGEPEVRAFLDHLLRDRQMRPATLRVYAAALRFLYDATLGRPEVMCRVPYRRRAPEHVPEILSPAEVAQLLGAVRSLKHRAMVMTA
jgi:integrase